MVSALTSTRLVSAQLALTTLLSDDSSDDSSTSNSSSSSLASSLLGDSSSNSVSSVTSQSQTMLASLLGSMTGSSLSSSSDTSTDSSSTSSTTSDTSTDISSSSFMALLKQDLTTTAEGPGDGAKQAKAMLSALDAGTLTVADPTKGVSITAWDPSASDTSSSDSSSASESHAATSITTSGWNDYLKEHLERNSDATFTRTADNSFIDKTTGNEAYFGQVGTQYYYLSWPASSASSTASSGGTPATASTSGS